MWTLGKVLLSSGVESDGDQDVHVNEDSKYNNSESLNSLNDSDDLGVCSRGVWLEFNN